MKEGDAVIAPLAQADGAVKNRPVLLLRELPAFGDFLACGISTQLNRTAPGFDEVIAKTDSDFDESGLISDSVVRLSFLAVLPRHKIAGSIGNIAIDRRARLPRNLCRYLLVLLDESHE